NRILTAAHVVSDAVRIKSNASAGDACDITLTFGVTKKPVAGPVYIEWSGADAGVDVAVLRCELPAELQSAPRLLTTPPSTPIKWFAQGYTDFGKQTRSGGKDGYEGALTKFSESEATVALGCDAGLIDSKQWAGGSGSVAFDYETAQTALAVITDYEGGKKLDHLIAVPICYLLNSAATKDGFRRAVEFGSYEERETYCLDVTKAITTQLNKLSKDLLVTVAKAIAQLKEDGASSINLDANEKILAQETAACIVNYRDVTAVVGRLVGLMEDMNREDSKKVASIVDHVLPLNYAPHLIQRLREQISQGKLGIVAGEVATRTLAEVIMAGHDQRPALYIDLSKRKTPDIPGRTAIDFQEDPEAGPHVLLRARNMVRDLAALFDGVLGLDGVQASQDPDGELADAELGKEIEVDAGRLQTAMKATRTIYNGRQLYCVLGSLENETHRSSRLRVLERIAKEEALRGLLFVELGEKNKADKREQETRHYIVARLVRA
ncbi:MAG: hypothetical protein AB7P69_12370, partial [Candidatus Binatia bacterium]